MAIHKTKKETLNPVDVDGDKLSSVIQKVARLYEGNQEQFATTPQIALILKVSRLYSEVPDEAVGNFLIKSGIPCEFRSSKAYFKITSLIEKQNKGGK